MPICPDCKSDKPRGDFYVASKRTGRLSSYCKECTRRIARERYHGPNHEQIKADTMARNAARENDPRRQRGYKYGMSREEYDAFVSSPCDICGTTEHKRGVDHCHRSGQNRGALCHRCNVGLGMYQDDSARLRSAAAYLEQYD